MARGTPVGLAALAALTLTSLAWAASGPNSSEDSSSLTSAAAGQCSKATALQVAVRHRFAATAGGDEVATVLCGSFVCQRSHAMAVAITPGTCGINGWAVFRYTGGDWQLVGSLHPGWVMAIEAVGSDIRETAPVPTGRFGCPTSGEPRTRIWHWNGSRLVPGPWKRSTPRAADVGEFYSPSRNIACGMFDGTLGREVVCQSRVPPQKVTMDHTGRVTICRDPTPSNTSNECGIGDPGEGKIPVLAYGRHLTVGRFRCDSLVTGVRCVVTATGKGFLINRDGVRRVGP